MTFDSLDSLRNAKLPLKYTKITEYVYSKMMQSLLEEIEAKGGVVTGGKFGDIKSTSFCKDILHAAPLDFVSYVLDGYYVCVNFDSVSSPIFEGVSVTAEPLLSDGVSYYSKHYPAKYFVSICVDASTQSISFAGGYKDLRDLLLNPSEIKLDLMQETEKNVRRMQELRKVQQVLFAY